MSVILMQASKNFSDTWLTYWINSIDTSNNTHSPETVLGTKLYVRSMKESVLCVLDHFILFWDNKSHCVEDEDTQSTDLEYENVQISLNSYYLAVYIVIAVFNSVMALVRAFSFAYAGLKAAKFIHSKLLLSVFYVNIFI